MATPKTFDEYSQRLDKAQKCRTEGLHHMEAGFKKSELVITGSLVTADSRLQQQAYDNDHYYRHEQYPHKDMSSGVVTPANGRRGMEPSVVPVPRPEPSLDLDDLAMRNKMRNAPRGM